MGFIDVFVRRPVLTTVLVLVALVLGAVSYSELGLRRFPQIEFPFATIVTSYPGGSPSEIETDITKRIEDAVSSIAGIEAITSYSQQGLSLVMIQFGLEEDIDVKAMDIRDKVDQIRAALPDEAEDPIVVKFQFSQFPVLTLALSGPQTANELYRFADEELKTRISQVPGVADVGLSGGERREVQVLLDARKLRRYRVPIGHVVLALQASNVDVPAGHITQRGREYNVRATGRFQRASEIEQVRIPTVGGTVLTVADIGEVRDTYAEARTASRFDGQTAIILTVQAQSDANEVSVVDGVRAILPGLQRLLPSQARLDIAEDTSGFIKAALSNVTSNLLIGILLTAVTLYLFLKSWRGTVVVAVVMPASIIATFALLRWSGFTLNILTLTGLAMTIGVLVNNSILIVEDTSTLIEKGMDPKEAAVVGTKDIVVGILGATSTNVVVFLPVAFMGEIIGRFFKELGLTVVYSTMVSLAIAFSLTPMMCAYMLRSSRRQGPAWAQRLSQFTVGWIADLWLVVYHAGKRLFMAVLDWCLVHPRTTVVLSGLSVGVGVAILGTLGAEFMPSSDEGRFRVTVQMPAGTPLSVSDAVVRRVEEEVKQVPYLEHYHVRVGQVSGFLGGSSGGVNLAEVSVTVCDRADRPVTVDDLMNRLRPKLAGIPSARVSVESAAHGPSASPVMIEISGDDLDALRRIGLQVMGIVEGVKGTASVAKSWQAGQPEVRVIPKQEEANRHRIDPRSVAGEVRSYVEGTTASQFKDRDENYDIQVKLSDADRQSAGDVSTMFISSPASGQMIPIGQVAEVREESGPTLITRKDRRRLVTVSAGLTGERSLGEVTGDIAAEINRRVVLPESVSISYAGEVEFMQKNFRELFKALAIAGALTFLCTAGIIESFLFGAVIMLTVPISLICVSLFMLATGVTVNVFALMGMIVQVGMVVNNAIIIVDYAMRQEGSGRSAAEIVRHACDARYRMIFMTNITNVVALTPLALGLGFAGEVFRPLAIVGMAGSFGAWFLSMLVIPAIYVLVRRRRLDARKAAGPALSA